MKPIFIFLLSFALCAGSAVAGDVNYFNRSWAEAKEKARAEHKYIFVDCYTDWCGWCKVMDKETMSDPGVTALMNDQFITVKMDMEKGEGMKLAAKYHISGFPTFIFFNPEGDYIYQVVGYQKKAEFIKELNNATDKTKQFSAPGFSPSVDVPFPEFYKMIFAGNGKRQFPAPSDVSAYLDQQKDLFSEVNWGIVSQCELDEKYNAFFYSNISKYKSLYGANSVNDKLNSLLGNKLQNAIKNKSDAEFGELLKMVNKYITDEPDMSVIFCKVAYYKETKEWNKYAVAMDAYVAKKGYDNPGYINAQSRPMSDGCTDKKLLKTAATWMNGAVKTEPKYAYLDTYAALLYKSGQHKEAERWANKAIEQGKKKGDNTASAEELLVKIRAGK